VASIGFPPEFASSAEARREPEELISGPIELPPLHDFQQEVFDGLRALLASGTGRRRAVISLPTGGGKTRVTVEAAVRLVLAPEGRHAQRSLDCPDRRVVRAGSAGVSPGLGQSRRPANEPAHRPPVGRQSQSDRAGSGQARRRRGLDPDAEQPRRRGGSGLAAQARLVVVDECHHAITPSYSALLRWLDAEAPRPGAAEKDEPPSWV
jgi:hypothetical protein